MTVRILLGDVREKLRELPADSVDIVVTSPPYWGLRDYGVEGQLGLEPTLGEHLDAMVDVFDEVRRVMKPTAPLFLNYGDCYATKPNGRSAAETKAAGNDDRTFRDKPFSTVGPIYSSSHDIFPSGRRGGGNAPAGAIYRPGYEKTPRAGRSQNKGNVAAQHGGRIIAGGFLKPKDLCMVPNRLAIALQDDGWWVRSEIIWGKPNGMPDSSGRYRPSTAHEKIFLLGKTDDPFYDFEAVKKPAKSGAASWKMPDGWDTGPGGHGKHHRQGREKGAPAANKQAAIVDNQEAARARRSAGFNERWDESEDARDGSRLLRNYEIDVWHLATAAYKEAHFATFPPALVERCLIAGLPKGVRGLVLDPFGGAGTTGLVADRMGHDAVLIELNPEYAGIARRRIDGDAPLLSSMAAE